MSNFEKLRAEAIKNRQRINAHGVVYSIAKSIRNDWGVMFYEDGSSYVVNDGFASREKAIEWAEAQEF